VNAAGRERLVVNVGCGPRGGPLPPHFQGWRELRVDVDTAVEPDIVAELTDLSAIPAGSADAVWASHCVEHLYAHEVPVALAQFRRLLRADGFACLIVPDLQTVAQYVAADRMHETLYHSHSGPITPHDVMFGYGAAIAAGHSAMAHRCGFTPGVLQQCFRDRLFAEVILRRRVHEFELAAVAWAMPVASETERTAVLDALVP
jgi:predicted SAM-dependent methyltransferase